MTQLMPVKANGFTFDVRVDGPDTGAPVVLLHGWPQDSRSWRKVNQDLTAEGLRTIAPDQRGYSPGARPEGVDAYALVDLAADVLALADALGHDSFHLVGHDWGASVAWHLAAFHPERVRSLVAVSVPHLAAFGEALVKDADQQARSGYMQLLRMTGKAEEVLLEDSGARLRDIYLDDVDPADVDGYLERFSQPGAMTAVLNWYRAMDASTGELPDVKVPTTYVWGNNDIALGRYGAERCGDHVTADYRFVEVDGGHWLPDTHPKVIAAETLARTRV